MGARNKVRRLSHGRTDREWSCATADPDRPRLDGQISSAAAALANLNVKTAYIDGELCGVDDAGLPSFAQTQAATDGERGVHLVYYAFDLLHIGGWDVSGLSLIERKALLEPLFPPTSSSVPGETTLALTFDLASSKFEKAQVTLVRCLRQKYLVISIRCARSPRAGVVAAYG